MRRILITCFILGLLAGLLFGGFHEWTPPAKGATNSCGNSYPADGHNGPWYTSSNQTYHGNSVAVNCPTNSTHWHVLYAIQWSNTGSSWTTYLSADRSGDGDQQFSIGWGPLPCDGGLHIWRTHVHNYVTGGNINKPSGGGGVYLGC